MDYAPAPAPSLHLPFALLCSAVAVVMVTQTIGVFRQQKTLNESKVQLAEAITKRKVLVDQSTAIQAKLEALIVDLLILGKTDEDAKTIIAKHRIQQNLKSSPGGETPAE